MEGSGKNKRRTSEEQPGGEELYVGSISKEALARFEEEEKGIKERLAQPPAAIPEAYIQGEVARQEEIKMQQQADALALQALRGKLHIDLDPTADEKEGGVRNADFIDLTNPEGDKREPPANATIH